MQELNHSFDALKLNVVALASYASFLSPQASFKTPIYIS